VPDPGQGRQHEPRSCVAFARNGWWVGPGGRGIEERLLRGRTAGGAVAPQRRGRSSAWVPNGLSIRPAPVLAGGTGWGAVRIVGERPFDRCKQPSALRRASARRRILRRPAQDRLGADDARSGPLQARERHAGTPGGRPRSEARFRGVARSDPDGGRAGTLRRRGIHGACPRNRREGRRRAR
jgi:hypothetical protein